MYQRILLGVASLRINKVDHGKARVCHFGPYGEYRVNEAASNKILWYAIYFHPIEWAQQVSASAVKTELRSPLSHDTYKYKNIHPLKFVSLCTHFSCFSTISSFGLYRLSSKLVGMFFGIVPMFVLKDFVWDCFVAQICAKTCVPAVIRAYLRDEAMPILNKILKYEHWNYNYPKEHA